MTVHKKLIKNAAGKGLIQSKLSYSNLVGSDFEEIKQYFDIDNSRNGLDLVWKFNSLFDKVSEGRFPEFEESFAVVGNSKYYEYLASIRKEHLVCAGSPETGYILYAVDRPNYEERITPEDTLLYDLPHIWSEDWED